MSIKFMLSFVLAMSAAYSAQAQEVPGNQPINVSSIRVKSLKIDVGPAHKGYMVYQSGRGKVWSEMHGELNIQMPTGRKIHLRTVLTTDYSRSLQKGAPTDTTISFSNYDGKLFSALSGDYHWNAEAGAWVNSAGVELMVDNRHSPLYQQYDISITWESFPVFSPDRVSYFDHSGKLLEEYDFTPTFERTTLIDSMTELLNQKSP